MFLSVYGHVNLDIILNLKKFPDPNTSTEVSGTKRNFGGTAGNIARVSAELGTPLNLVSYVGENFPEDYLKALEKSGVGLSHLKKVKDYQTSTCWIMNDREHNQMAIMDQGPMRDLEKFQPDISPIRESEIIHIATGRPGYYRKVAEMARELGKTIAFDPAQELHYVYTPETFSEIIQFTDIFFCNEKEGETAVKYLGLQKLPDLLDYTDTIIRTVGKKGSRILTKSENREPKEIKIPAVKVKNPKDTTGAGDAYRAGFYAALYRKYPLKTCGTAGAITASHIIKTEGGQTNIPTWALVEKELEKLGLL